MPDFPRTILVETTTRCPADCIICPNKKIGNRPRDMTLRLFKKIVDDCRGQELKEFCPFVHGEPFAWKYFDKGLDYGSRMLPDAGVIIYTNGYLLDKNMTDILFRHNVREMHFSIDGFSKQVYEQHRHGLDYDRVLTSVTSFLNALRESKAGIRTCVDFTETEQNEAEVKLFKSFWEKLVDVVNVIPCDGRGGDGKLPAFTEGRQLPCFQVEDHAYILSDGSVVPCCKDWAGYSIMGNVAEQPLGEIWNSVDYRTFRKKIRLGTKSDIEVCQRCLNDRL